MTTDANLKTLKDITSWTCECTCVTFDNEKCRSCGKSPKYGEIDYDRLKTEAKKIFLDILKHNKNPFKVFMKFFDFTEEELAKGDDLI